MSRKGGDYSQGKRQREQQQQRKQQEKAERRARRREQGPAEIEIVSAEDVTGRLPSSEEALRAMEQRAQAPRGVAAVPCRLFVGGLGTVVTEADLREAFGAYGGIADAIVMVDRATGQSRGFGFVTMESRKDAMVAIEALNGAEINGRRIAVNVATDRGR